jgi:hypothetical protein
MEEAAGTVEYYVDGSSIGTRSGFAGSIYDGTAAFMIGSETGGSCFNGSIDDVSASQ